MQVSWYTGQAIGTLTQAPSASPAPSSSDAQKDSVVDTMPTSLDGEDSQMPDEVEAGGGWGGDDDGFGMM